MYTVQKLLNEFFLKFLDIIVLNYEELKYVYGFFEEIFVDSAQKFIIRYDQKVLKKTVNIFQLLMIKVL